MEIALPKRVLLLSTLLISLGSLASAATQMEYTQAAFAEAQAHGKRILVDVEAPWCSTCAVQRPIITTLGDSPALADLIVFTVDFDHDTQAVRSLRVPIQSTLILFQGRVEIARLTGATDPAVIEAFLAGLPSRYAEASAISAASYVLALLAGVLSVLSPCVLPLLPIIIAGAAASQRFGPAALAAGLAASFATIGLMATTISFGVGLEPNVFRLAAAAMMALFGLVLLSRSLEARLALLATPVETLGNRLLQQMAPSGLWGQFVIGLLLGALWSPCVGPVLGAAATLAAQHHAVPQATLIMLLFGLGAGLPLALIAALSRETMLRWRARMGAFGQVGHLVLGAILLATGLLMLSGLDRSVETALLQATPDWLARLATRV